MMISCRVIPRSSKEEIVDQGNGSFKVYVRLSPERGKANERICELFAEKFHVSKRQVRIVKGETSRQKVLQIE